MTEKNYNMSSLEHPAFPPISSGKIILNGENPFIRLSNGPGEPLTTDASLWTINYSPAGAGHALFIKSELTDNKWEIYSDNIEMVRFLQNTVQGMLNPETATSKIPVKNATFAQKGNLETKWEQSVSTPTDTILLSWSDFIEPLLMSHDQATDLPVRPYGVSVVMIPARKASLTYNGQKAAGSVWPCLYDHHPFSTASLAFSESWREA